MLPPSSTGKNHGDSDGDGDGDGDGNGDGDGIDDFHLSLVCLHYLALLLLELRHQGQPQFYIKVTFLTIISVI